MRVTNQKFIWALMLILAASLLASCGGKEERKAKYLERGKTFFAEKNYDKAKIEFKNVLQIDPKSAEAFLYIGEIEEATQNWARAFGNYSKAADLNPELISPHVHLAKIYLAQASALREQGNEVESANALGLAQERVKEILAREPENLEGLTLEATLWVNEGEMEKAARQLESVIDKDAGLRSAAVLLSGIYDEQGRTLDAEAVLLNAIASNDEPVGLQIRLSGFYRKHKQNDKAEKILRGLISDHPDELAYRVSLASFLAKNEQLDKAEEVLRETIAADPEDVQRYVFLTELLSAKRSNQVAIDELKRFIQQKPELSDLKLGLVKLYLNAGRTEEAQKTLKSIIANSGGEPAGNQARVALAQIIAAEDPDSDQITMLIDKVLQDNPRDNDALLLKAGMAARKGDYVEAIADYRSVLRDQPNSADLLRLLAAAHAANGETELARDMMERAIESDPKDARPRLGMARLLFQANDIDGALEQVGDILKSDQYNQEALAVKFELLARKGDADGMEAVAKLMQAGAPDKEDGFIREARLKFAQKDYASALRIIDQVLATNPGSVSALLIRADVLVAQERYAEAISVAEKLQKIEPDSAEGYLRKGNLLRIRGDQVEAMKQYEVAFRKAPESVAVLTAILGLELKNDGVEKAEQRLLGLLEKNPQHRYANDMLGTLYMKDGDLNAAVEAFQRQVDVDPENPVAYARLSQAHLAQADPANAAAVYEQGLEVLPDNVRLLIGLAGVKEVQKDYDKAISCYERVLRQQPDNAVGINNLAALLSDHRTDSASLGKATELAAKLMKTNQPAFVDTAGWVYYRNGDYDKAIEILEGVVEQAPTVPVFQYHLGMAYLKKGDKAAAREHLLKATNGGPSYDGVEEATAALETL